MEENRHRVRKFVAALVLDFVVALLAIGAFLLWFYVLPRTEQGENVSVVESDSSARGTFALPGADAEQADGAAEEAGQTDADTDTESSKNSPGSRPRGGETSGSDTETDSGSSAGSRLRRGEASDTDSGSDTETGSGGSAGSRPWGEEMSDTDSGSDSGSGAGSHSRQGGRPSGGTGGPMGNGNTGTEEISSDLEESEELSGENKTRTETAAYQDDSIQVTIEEVCVGEGTDQITYYVADVYVTDIEQIQTAFATGSYGKNLRESTLAMAEENGALLAVSGDSYGNNETGIVVRNGVLYRSEANDAEICVLYYDGTMAVYTPEEFDAANVLEEDVWQIWNFGPSLLEDGEIKDSFQTTSYLNRKNPRCAIGYLSPGHYCFVVVDGRDEGYSCGATMSEMAQIMKEEGCVLAYNLDGGKSSAMVFQGEYVNQPADGGRAISDIIYLVTEGE